MNRQPQVGDIWVWRAMPGTIQGAKPRRKLLWPSDREDSHFKTGRVYWTKREILESVAAGDELYEGSSLLRRLLEIT